MALLHDVMEDTDVTAADLFGAGMSARVVEALELLCRNPAEPYLRYIERLANDPLARKVKVADLRHNSDLSRLDAVTPSDEERVRKYARALQILQDAE